MSCGALCVRSVQVARPEETVLAASQRMAAAGVGTVVVLSAGQRPVGIVTDRDVVVRCVAEQRDPAVTPLAVVMTSPVQHVYEATPLDEALAHMAGAHARRLVVLDAQERLVGILALDDVVDLLAEEAGSIARIVAARSPRA
jgi:CBS domain-containing protein